MLLNPGTRLGPHEILGQLGAGGMGEVYLARDTRLDREVALKILPRRMTHDTEAIARFRREAFTLASLNHPNIATVYGFEETADGPMALVLEFVAGETLAARLRRERLPVDEALRICAQIAEALEAAHERGVIHRDMKPGNVMIGPRGIVKVLDFGLARKTRALGTPEAKLMDEEEPPREECFRPEVPPPPALDAPTLTLSSLGPALFPDTPSDAVTVSGPGMTVGTPGYMSPEQVEARKLDERADIFAFGCILYECLTGQRAFSGGDAVQTMIAALDHTPDPSALPPRTPPRVRMLIEQCLEKDATERLKSMRSARVVIEEALGIRRASALREGGAYATPHNLPAPASSFVGRVEVLRESGRLLGSTRLVTLSGMGGSGKTRIAAGPGRRWSLFPTASGSWISRRSPRRRGWPRWPARRSASSTNPDRRRSNP